MKKSFPSTMKELSETSTMRLIHYLIVDEMARCTNVYAPKHVELEKLNDWVYRHIPDRRVHDKPARKRKIVVHPNARILLPTDKFIISPPRKPADQKKKKLALLTPAEDKAWVAALTYALTELHYGQERAGRYAWRDVCKQFPRLSAFDGSLA